MTKTAMFVFVSATASTVIGSNASSGYHLQRAKEPAINIRILVNPTPLAVMTFADSHFALQL